MCVKEEKGAREGGNGKKKRNGEIEKGKESGWIERNMKNENYESS